MLEAPSLFSICSKSISLSIIHGGYDYVQDIFNLPGYVLDSLIMNLSPLALHEIHQLSFDGDEVTACKFENERKRGRYDIFDAAWKELYKKRWPDKVEKVETNSPITLQLCEGICSWHQLYWEAHLQNCLAEAAEKALLPAFDGHIARVEISDNILSSIGCIGDGCKFSQLSYHCNKFGNYARCLKLQNVLCVAETCDLLKSSKLQALTFRRIKQKSHVAGMCMLLKQNRETLLSIELIYSHLSPANVDKIFYSLCEEGTETHGIRHLSIKSSVIFPEYKSLLIPSGFTSFLLAGRSLETLCFSENSMGRRCAKQIYSTLLHSSSSLTNLEISDNEITGWLLEHHEMSTDFSSLSDTSLKSLEILNLSGNNFCMHDAEDLSRALIGMPNLKSLDISHNPIEDDGIRKLIPYFIKAIDKPCPISDIKLENCDLSSSGMTEFLISLPVCKEPLNSLSIADNDLGSSVAASLAKFIGTLRVRILNIEEIGLGPLGFQELEKEMSNKVDVVSINISKNRGGIKAAKFVSALISRAPRLMSVNAGFNLMPPESLPVIHDALKQSKGKLEQLDLRGNSFPCSSINESRILEFQHRGMPIVTFSSASSISTLHDDDP